MGLSPEFVAAHIATWEATLSASYRNYRARWPRHLFHHAPVDNAADILRSGKLLSRDASRGLRKSDVAGKDIIALRAKAHAHSRFYFRPKTPTQFRIEGIRKVDECWNGDPATHAPILVMLVFDAQSVFSDPAVRFSNGNMQTGGAQDGDSEAFFSTIDFDKVYHEGGIGGDYSIITARCAEVLGPSELDIGGKLRKIYCRSAPERQTLLHLLGASADQWRSEITVVEDIQVFQREFTYVEEVALQADGLVFRLHPRDDRKQIVVEVRVWDAAGSQRLQFGPQGLDASPSTPGKTKWIIEGAIEAGRYRAEILLEGCLAFHSELVLDPTPF